MNANSLALRIQFGDIVFLLPGDIQTEDIEASLMPFVDPAKLKCHILVAPGHGIHPIPKAFGAATYPEVSIASVFPRYAKGIRSTPDLKALGTQTYVTGLHGTVQVVTDGKTYKVTTERDDTNKPAVTHRVPLWPGQAPVGGGKFEDIAKKQSKDPGSGAKGGDLDWANPSSYVSEFTEALVKLTAPTQPKARPAAAAVGLSNLPTALLSPIALSQPEDRTSLDVDPAGAKKRAPDDMAETAIRQLPGPITVHNPKPLPAGADRWHRI